MVQENIEKFVIETESIEDRGDLVIGNAKAHGRGVSGVGVRSQAIVATRFGDCNAWRMAMRPTEIEALAAVELSE